MSKFLRPACLFIDLGGVLFHDEYVELYFYYHVFIQVKKHFPSLSEEIFFKDRKNLYAEFKNDWINFWLESLLPKEVAASIISLSWEKTLRHYDKLFKPYQDAFVFLEKLSRKFPLYCVANQPLQSEQIISNLGFKQHFKSLFIDTLIGYSKPDPRLFQAALKESRLHPKDVLHIGDRLDNDIIPAKICGMQAIQLTQPIGYVHLPFIPHYFCHYFYHSLQTVWHRWETSTIFGYIHAPSYADVLELLID